MSSSHRLRLRGAPREAAPPRARAPAHRAAAVLRQCDEAQLDSTRPDSSSCMRSPGSGVARTARAGPDEQGALARVQEPLTCIDSSRALQSLPEHAGGHFWPKCPTEMVRLGQEISPNLLNYVLRLGRSVSLPSTQPRRRRATRIWTRSALARWQGPAAFTCESCGFAVTLREREQVPGCPRCAGARASVAHRSSRSTRVDPAGPHRERRAAGMAR